MRGELGRTSYFAGWWKRSILSGCSCHGRLRPFKKIEELTNVRGVGEKNFLKLKPQITIAAAKAEHGGQR